VGRVTTLALLHQNSKFHGREQASGKQRYDQNKTTVPLYKDKHKKYTNLRLRVLNVTHKIGLKLSNINCLNGHLHNDDTGLFVQKYPCFFAHSNYLSIRI